MIPAEKGLYWLVSVNFGFCIDLRAFSVYPGPGDKIMARVPDWELDKFMWKEADNSATLLRETYAMRYSSYCLERGFLDPDLFPQGLETDEYDEASLHLAVCHRELDLLTATARIIVSEGVGGHERRLPAYRYCDIEPGALAHLQDVAKIGELSRMVICRSAIATVSKFETARSAPARPFSRMTMSTSAILMLYKSVYQTSRRERIRHLVAAMEPSLRRLSRRFHFPFHQIGPVVNYHGSVAPFLLDLDELDDSLNENAPWLLAGFRGDEFP